MDWVSAAQRGDIIELQKFADINHLISDSRATALHYSAEGGHDQAVQFLLDRNADYDARDKYGRTPLYLAVFHGHLDVAKRLLQNPEKRANPDTPCKCGTSAVSKAAENGHITILNLLLEAGAKVETRNINRESPEDLAKRNGHLAVSNRFRYYRTRRVESLVKAARNGSVRELKELISSGVDVNSRDQTGSSALDLAAQSGQRDVISYLITSANVNPNTANAHDVTPLHWAAEYGHADIIDLLLSNNANPNASDKGKKTPLHWAAERGHEAVADRLCNHPGNSKVDINARAVGGRTPLMLAAEHGKRGFVRLLLGLKADVTLEDNEGQTARDLAEYNGYDDVADDLPPSTW